MLHVDITAKQPAHRSGDRENVGMQISGQLSEQSHAQLEEGEPSQIDSI
jgi:hypothetical protein